MRISDWSSDVCSSDLQAVTPGPHFNAKAARAKLMARSGSEDGKYEWGPGVAKENRAHGDDKMTCFTCHLSWTTSCGGRSEENTSELKSLMRISYAVFCLKNKNKHDNS